AASGHHSLRISSTLQCRQMGGHELENVDPLALEVIRQHGLTLSPLMRDNMQAATRSQRGKNHRIAEVGGNCRYRRVLHARLELQSLGNAQYVVDNVSVLDPHTLGTAG